MIMITMIIMTKMINDHDDDDNNDDEDDDNDNNVIDDYDDDHLASGLYSSHGSPEFSMRKRTPAHVLLVYCETRIHRFVIFLYFLYFCVPLGQL